MPENPNPIVDELIVRYPALKLCLADVLAASEVLVRCYEGDGILYLCGNGGSAADAEHIVGELMKSFAIRRPLPSDALGLLDPPEGDAALQHLEGALRAVSLCGHPALATAFANDVAPELVFAQQVYAYGRPGDILLGISTSGNARNVLLALQVARA